MYSGQMCSAELCSGDVVTTMRVVTLELVGAAELLQLLGVGRTRLGVLTARDDFPEPIAELVMGKIWDLADIRAWAEKTGRELKPITKTTKG